MPTQIPEHPCDCGNDTFYFTKDLNLTAAWKVGNKYCRVCTACASRYFLAKSIWEQVEDQYVIVKGEEEPVPIFDCPECGEGVTGTPPNCPFCDVPYLWDEQEEVEEVEDPDPHDQQDLDLDDIAADDATEPGVEADDDGDDDDPADDADDDGGHQPSVEDDDADAPADEEADADAEPDPDPEPEGTDEDEPAAEAEPEASD